MRRRTRKLIGTIVILAFVMVYALIAVLVAQLKMPGQSWWVQTIFYAVAGLAWVVPLLPLIKWMERPDPIEAGAR